MTAVSLTPHAEARLRQRGLCDAGLDLVLELASPVGPEEWMMTREDASQEISRLKKRIQHVERLSGMKVILRGDAVITVYRSDLNDQRRTLRRGRASK